MRLVRACAVLVAGLAALVWGMTSPTAEVDKAFAQSCPSGCIKGKPGSLVVQRRGVVASKSGKEYFPRSDARAFKNSSEANGAGFSEYVPPDATPTPTPTATPAIPSLEGRYRTDNSSPLTVSSETCSTVFPTPYPTPASVSVDVDIFHDADDSVVRGNERIAWPTPAGTPTPVGGARSWGGVLSEDSFEVTDSFPSEAIAGACPTPYINRRYVFTDVDSDSASVQRTDRIICLGDGTQCQKVWSGTVGRAN